MLIKCPECGKEISDKATLCPNCGAPIEKKSTNILHTSYFTISYSPIWTINGKRISVLVNDRSYGEFSSKEPFTTRIPIDGGTTKVQIRSNIQNVTKTFNFERNQNYELNFKLSRFTGQFDIELLNQHRQVIDSIKSNVIIFILAFLFPIFGIAYMILCKSKASYSIRNLSVSIIYGFLIGFLFLYIVPVACGKEIYSITESLLFSLFAGGLVPFLNNILINKL